jgi:ABC-2 type transport system ATP-binding protein
MSTPAIQFSGVVKDYGTTLALRGIDLSVQPGQIFGFLGPNGAGKTTAIRILLDLIRPTFGSARVLGLDCQRDSVAVRERCGYLPGELHLYDGMTGDAFLDLIDSFRPAKRDAAYRARLVERLCVDPSRQIRALSKGNKQKLAIVQALMHRPDVLILDEPTSGLDPLVQQEVTRILEDVARDGCTVFFSSHVLPEVERVSHTVAIIRAGEIVAVEDIAKLKARAMHVLEVTFAQEPPRDAFTSLPGVTELRRDGPLVHLQSRDTIDALLKQIARYEVLDLRTEQPSLEDYFLGYYGAGDGDEPHTEVQRAAS